VLFTTEITERTEKSFSELSQRNGFSDCEGNFEARTNGEYQELSVRSVLSVVKASTYTVGLPRCGCREASHSRL
jgi:hypothetical protein